jgi:hypothetical protein
MVGRALRRAPNTRDTKFPASAFAVVIGAIDLSPRVRASGFDCPAIGLGVLERALDFLPGVGFSCHTVLAAECIGNTGRCQLTTFMDINQHCEAKRTAYDGGGRFRQMGEGGAAAAQGASGIFLLALAADCLEFNAPVARRYQPVMQRAQPAIGNARAEPGAEHAQSGNRGLERLPVIHSVLAIAATPKRRGGIARGPWSCATRGRRVHWSAQGGPHGVLTGCSRGLLTVPASTSNARTHARTIRSRSRR